MKKWDVFVYGDINIDLVVKDVERLPNPGEEEFVEEMGTFIGGGAALFTMGLAKLGIRTVFQGCVGNDMYGTFIHRELQNLGVDDSLLEQSDSENTGISISFTTKRDRCFVSYLGTNSRIDLSRIDCKQLAQARHIHVTGYRGEENHETYLTNLRKYKEVSDLSISFDVGWDDTGVWSPRIQELFPYIDILFMNESEALNYSRKESIDEALEFLSQGDRIAVIKCGKKGAVAKCQSKVYEKAAYSVICIDTTGAGDSFNAGFIASYLEGNTIERCLEYGNACGAFCVTALGGNQGFPRKSELEEFIKG